MNKHSIGNVLQAAWKIIRTVLLLILITGGFLMYLNVMSCDTPSQTKEGYEVLSKAYELGTKIMAKPSAKKALADIEAAMNRMMAQALERAIEAVDKPVPPETVTANNPAPKTPQQSGSAEAQPQTHTPKQTVLQNNPEFCQELFNLINVSRQEAGLPPLEWNPTLAKAAEKRAIDMITNDYFRHYGVTAEGSIDMANAEVGKLDPSYGPFIAENIQIQDPEPEMMHEAFMKSEGHRENILSKQSQEIGIAVMFGSPTCINPDPEVAASLMTVVEIFGIPKARLLTQ
jgi:uncharacterized protein YkwD